MLPPLPSPTYQASCQARLTEPSQEHPPQLDLSNSPSATLKEALQVPVMLLLESPPAPHHQAPAHPAMKLPASLSTPSTAAATFSEFKKTSIFSWVPPMEKPPTPGLINLSQPDSEETTLEGLPVPLERKDPTLSQLHALTLLVPAHSTTTPSTSNQQPPSQVYIQLFSFKVD